MASALHRHGPPLIQLDEQNAESEAGWGNDDHPTGPAVRFGIDLGGVLWHYIRGDCGPVEAAQQWVRTLVNRIVPANVHIISKVGRWAEEVWSNVLRDSRSCFLQNTGMLEQNVHWVRDKTGPLGKAPIATQLGLTHFVDDRLDVLFDIQTHFAEHRLTLPHLYLVPTTTLETDGPNMRFADMQRARNNARQNLQMHPLNSMQCLKGLCMVPFPEAWAT
jgi:hypothetical protein